MPVANPGAVDGGADLVPDGGAWRCRGAWTLDHLPSVEARWAQGGAARTAAAIDAGGITALDTAGAVVLARLAAVLGMEPGHADLIGLPAAHATLYETAARHWRENRIGPPTPPGGTLERIGTAAWDRLVQGTGALGFLGESTVALLGALSRPRSIRARAVLSSLEIDGVRAIPIIGLLAFLMGVVIAYQGAAQLARFGTNIFVVDLVGISMLREISPLVTAILVAGRSGSAYAAQIGTMKVTEEIDALRTLGLVPMDLLVVPKILALSIALPLLTVLADAVGVVGGMLVALVQLKVTFPEFLARFQEAVALKHLLIGVAKAPVFAAIIVLVGCHQGFRIRGGVDDVGRRTTISVVQSIFLVIVFDAFCSIVLNWWDL
ncbi:MAG: MlaE family ABC transporter permease [Gammaproteobacteria bacterium]